MNKHIFVFCGPAMTGKTTLCNLINKDECMIIDDFVVKYQDIRMIDVESLMNKIRESDKQQFVIVCNPIGVDIDTLIREIKYYEYMDTMDVSLLKFECIY